uniref:BHLH domain-containing protein n=1 Tax=Rhizophora mucronata TaxID=61149 RepID=A0A2P2KKC1_RHIMU
MSYHVYSLGEGIVGQVAVTGKHKWIFADRDATNSFSSFEFSDGWQSLFSAGIKTIVVVAVAPYGVIQLGSLNKVVEDMKLVASIKDVFLTLQDSSVGHVTSSPKYNMQSSSFLHDLSTKGFSSEDVPDSLCYLDKAANKEGPNDWFLVVPHLQKHSDNSSSISSFHQDKAVGLSNNHDGLELSTPGNDRSVKLLNRKQDGFCLENQNQTGLNLISDQICGQASSVWREQTGGSEQIASVHLNKALGSYIKSCDVMLPSEKFRTNLASSPVGLLDSTLCDRVKSDSLDVHLNWVSNVPKSSGVSLKKDLENNMECQAESSWSVTPTTFAKLYAGSDLHEALGPAFLQKCSYFDCEAENPEVGNTVDIPSGMSSSQMTFDRGSENLLEAVVGNVCYSNNNIKGEKSACTSVQSLLTTEKMSETSSQTMCFINSADCSIRQSPVIEEEAQNDSYSTEMCGATSKGLLSTCPNACSEQLDRCSEPSRSNKKRARPGENPRPRPRDRQLIQDRIKELRDLVPNGSKCSIDSLLERTIKHMLFLESITKHADKLKKCAEVKKGADAPSYDQGSSCAVEVGGHMKVSSIIVENLNKNGQMLVEVTTDVM